MAFTSIGIPLTGVTIGKGTRGSFKSTVHSHWRSMIVSSTCKVSQ